MQYRLSCIHTSVAPSVEESASVGVVSEVVVDVSSGSDTILEGVNGDRVVLIGVGVA